MLVGAQESILAFGKNFQPWNAGAWIVGTYSLPTAIIAGLVPMDESEGQKALKDIEIACRNIAPDDVILLLPWDSNALMSAIVRGLSVLPVSIHLAPHRSVPWFDDPIINRIGSATAIRLARPPLSLRDRIIKRMTDIVLSAIGLICFIPFFLVIAFAIKRDSPGPVLFRQQRYGFNQDPFRIFKFRTMSVTEDGHVIVQATQNDARITRVGAFLRKTNIDELPQLWNVLCGDMSLVGPRPHALAHNRMYEEEIALYARRHNVKPGITGWAQVNGHRGETETTEKMKDRVEHDLYYIDNWSFGLDVKILILTVVSRKAYRNAY
jgi:Undecaprenyl-phosphate glucose phosphotransferase